MHSSIKNNTHGIKASKKHKNYDNKLLIAYAISISLWIFDFKAIERGVGVVVQAFILFSYATTFAVILLHAIWQRCDWRHVQKIVLVGLIFVIFSATVGIINDQSYWLLFTNCIPLLLFTSTIFTTYIVFRYSINRKEILEKLKTICLFTIVSHMGIAIFQFGLDFSKTRYQFLSGASIPALAVFAMFLIFSIKKKELLIAFANLTVVLISVTRTQLVALAAQMFACFVIYPRIIQNPRIIKNILLIITIASSIIAIDVFSGIGLTSRWTDRLLIENKFGTDPTALTRTAENNYMRQEIIASWQKFIFGNGLAAETSLIGPEAVLAGQLVGTASVATHSYGFGHNNYLSLLFIGGLAVGAPILIILLLNGCSSLLLSRALIQDNKTDATVLYACVWGSLIIVGLLTTSFLSGIFEERTTSLWYGIGTGMFYWASSETKNLKKSNIDKH